MRGKLAVVIALVLASVSVIWAGSVGLAWDHSEDKSVVGYRIYYGPRPGVYTNRIEVGYVTTTRVTNLQDGATYYFAATAFSDEGLESEFSNEASAVVGEATDSGLESPDLKVAK